MKGSVRELGFAWIPDLSHVCGTGTDSGDSERAVAGAGGSLQSLLIDPEVLGRGSEAVAAAVLEAVQSAQTEAVQQVSKALSGFSADPAASDADQRRLGDMLAELESLTRRLAHQ